METLRIVLFGAPRCLRGEKLVTIQRRKAMALVAYLAATGQPHQRDALATMLWPDQDQGRARGNLRRDLSQLKSILGDEMLSLDGDLVALSLDADWHVDVVEFDEHLEVVRQHGDAPDDLCADCLSALTAAVSLYSDDFMAGFTLPDSPVFDDWQFFQSDGLRQALADALQRLVAWYSTRHKAEWESAIDYARRWLALDPLHEPAHLQLMQLYALAGQQAAALRQYEECVRLLDEELGVEPHPSTTEFYEAIRTRQFAGQRPIAALRVGQVDVTAEFPPVPRPAFLEEDAAQRSTESFTKPFIGRDAALARLEAALEAALAGAGSVLFISGEAGSGKTTLADVFAHQAQQTRPDLLVARGASSAYTGIGDPYLPFREAMEMLTGNVEAQWAAGLLSTEHARRLWGALPDTIATLVDHGADLISVFLSERDLLGRARVAAPDAAWHDRLTSLVTRHLATPTGLTQPYIFEQFAQVLYRLTRQHPLLLILDDLQWADADSLNLLFHLGRRLSGSRVLIVGCYRADEVALGRDGDRHPLDKLLSEFKRRFGDVWIDLNAVEEREGRAFIDAYLDLEPNDLSRSFRAALHQRTGGHALFTIELLRAMREHGDLVIDGTGRWVEGTTLNWATLPARVEGVIEERLGRLAPDEHELLSVASVEGTIFTAQVLAAVQELDERSVLRMLGSGLERRHGLVEYRGEQRIAGRILSHYQFTHALFQSYLYRELDVAERRLLHGRVADALEHLYASESDRIALKLAHHFRQAGNKQKEVHYLIDAGHAARRIGAYGEAIAQWERVLYLVADETAPAALVKRGAALRKLGSIYQILGQWETATDYLKQALILTKTIDDPAGSLSALSHLGLVRFKEGDLPRAVTYLNEALALGRDLSDTVRTARALIWLGAATAFSQSEGTFEEVVAYLDEGLELARSTGGSELEALALHQLGEVARLHHRYDEASVYYDGARAIYTQLEDRLGQMAVSVSQGHTAGACQEAEKAEAGYREALHSALMTGLIPLVLEALAGWANLLVEVNPELAAEWIGLVRNHPASQIEALTLCAQANDALSVALPADRTETALARGAALSLEAAVSQALA